MKPCPKANFMKKITIILKSGKEITFNCKDMTITKVANELTGYVVEGGSGKLFYVRLDEIAALLSETA